MRERLSRYKNILFWHGFDYNVEIEFTLVDAQTSEVPYSHFNLVLPVYNPVFLW